MNETRVSQYGVSFMVLVIGENCVSLEKDIKRMLKKVNFHENNVNFNKHKALIICKYIRKFMLIIEVNVIFLLNELSSVGECRENSPRW